MADFRLWCAKPVASSLLRRCAPFPVVYRAMSAEVLMRPDAGSRLERLEDRHALVTAVDREREQFRIHPVLRDFLLGELARTDPTALAEHRARGAVWLGQHGHLQESLALHVENGDRRAALSMLAGVVMPMFAADRLIELVDLIHGIGADVAMESGYLATMFAYAAMMTGDVICTQRWERAAQRFYTSHAFSSSDEEAAYFTMRAHLAPDGVAVMREDAEHARAIVGEASVWRSPTLMLCGIAAELCGDLGTATSLLDEAVHISAELVNRPALVMALSAGALLADRSGQHARARAALDQALEALDTSMAGYPQTALPLALAGLAAARGGDHRRGNTLLSSATALRPIVSTAIPWLGVQLRVVLARTSVILGDVATARTLCGEAEELLNPLPDARGLRAETAELARAIQSLPVSVVPPGTRLLTSAELRVLPHLSSHLTFLQIAARLHLSKNTVKTQAISIYRKLGATSRSEAVDIARELALIPE